MSGKPRTEPSQQSWTCTITVVTGKLQHDLHYQLYITLLLKRGRRVYCLLRFHLCMPFNALQSRLLFKEMHCTGVPHQQSVHTLDGEIAVVSKLKQFQYCIITVIYALKTRSFFGNARNSEFSHLHSSLENSELLESLLLF